MLRFRRLERIIMYFIPFVYLLIGTYTDIKYKSINLLTSLFFFIFALLYFCIFTKLGLTDFIIRETPGILLIVTSLIFKAHVGLGDGIILLVCGLFLGITDLFAILFFSCILLFIFALYKVIRCKVSKSYTIPYIPFLFLSYGLIFLKKGGI